MAEGFKGLKKEEHEKLVRAAKMYSNMTGESLDVSSIPVFSEEEDEKAKNAQAQQELDRQAQVDRRLEEARQEERRIRERMYKEPGENDGPIVTERAKDQGLKGGKGHDPAGKKG